MNTEMTRWTYLWINIRMVLGRIRSLLPVRSYQVNKCKKHSLSHQLTAQLHIENSKNKKMVITLLQHIA